MNKIEYFPQEKVRDILVTRTAIKTLTSEAVVEKVVNFQFKDIRDAVKSNESIEISGFGRLVVSLSKVKKKVIELEKALVNTNRLIEGEKNEEKLKQLHIRRELQEKVLDFLKQKL